MEFEAVSIESRERGVEANNIESAIGEKFPFEGFVAGHP